MDKKEREIVARMRLYALANYDFGGDYIYECWDDDAYLKFYNDYPDEWKDEMREYFEIFEERERWM